MMFRDCPTPVVFAVRLVWYGPPRIVDIFFPVTPRLSMVGLPTGRCHPSFLLLVAAPPGSIGDVSSFFATFHE